MDTNSLHKPFVITTVCRAEVVSFFRQEEVARLTDTDMKRIAQKMAEAYCETSFWIDLEIIAELVFEEKKQQAGQ